MTRHRVLYVMPNAVPGGAERATMLMIASHDRDRYEPGVLFFSQGPLVGDARMPGPGRTRAVREGAAQPPVVRANRHRGRLPDTCRTAASRSCTRAWPTHI